VEPEETVVVRSRNCKRLSAATDTSAKVEELLETAFSMQPVARQCNEDTSRVNVSTRAVESPLLGSAYKQRPVRTIRLYMCCSTVIRKMCRSVELLQLPVVTSYNCLINPITNPNHVSSH
jgi:hypothetical protein